jgi:putative phosphoribosyl transferase
MLGAVLREILGEGQSRDPERERASAGLPAITPGPSANSPVVLAIPRGGVAVAVGVARALSAPLDVLMVRKIGHPAAPELGLGAIAEDGAGGAAEPYFDAEMLSRAGLTADDLAGVVARERAELARRVAVYTHRSASAEREPKGAALSRIEERGSAPPLRAEARAPVWTQERRPRNEGPREPKARAGNTASAESTVLAGRLVIVVDDGLATGVTARAALRAARARGATRSVLAVPVAAPGAVSAIEKETGEVVTLVTPRRFRSVGEWYADFGQLTDADVLALLRPRPENGVP